MNTLVEQLQSRFPQAVTKTYEHNDRRIYVDVKPEHIAAVAGFIYNDLDFRYVIASGIDTPDAIEILYHFSHDPTGLMLSVRASLTDKEKPAIGSLTSVIKGISWIEREIHELLGVDFTGHPNLKHLLLSEDWPAGDYPLRHDNKRK